jgi:hypothetical protein
MNPIFSLRIMMKRKILSSLEETPKMKTLFANTASSLLVDDSLSVG